MICLRATVDSSSCSWPTSAIRAAPASANSGRYPLRMSMALASCVRICPTGIARPSSVLKMCATGPLAVIVIKSGRAEMVYRQKFTGRSESGFPAKRSFDAKRDGLQTLR